MAIKGTAGAARRKAQKKDVEAIEAFLAMLGLLPDSRRAQGRRYPLPTVVMVALLAMICGCDDASSMEAWGERHEKWLATFLDMPHGPPSQDVFLSVFAALPPEPFGKFFVMWTDFLRGRLALAGKHVAVDGKTSRRTHHRSREQPAVHTVSAWLSDAGLVLGQRKTETKSNEITAIPELLAVLDLRGATVTIDAMGCQTDIAAAIIERGGHYVLAVKDNQPTLAEEMVATFADAADVTPRALDQPPPTPVEVHETLEKGHGRLEKRTVTVARRLDWITTKARWPKLAYVARVESERTDLATGNMSVERRYFIGSDPRASVTRVGELIRAHWGIENGLHWVLDMAFNEDQARQRAGYCGANFATLRHMALNLIKRTPNRRLGVKNTRLLAGWDLNELVRIVVMAEI